MAQALRPPLKKVGAGNSINGISEVKVILPKVFQDKRGYFYESFNAEEFEELGLPTDFVQDNQSGSQKGVLRGLHFQKSPYEQGKLVRVVKGKVLDVAVDIRKNSPAYGKWKAVELSEDNRKMIWIPKGFAHGFLALEEGTIVQYKVSGNYYNKEAESGIKWDDPDLNIDWQLGRYGLKKEDLIISKKDRWLPYFKKIEN